MSVKLSFYYFTFQNCQPNFPLFLQWYKSVPQQSTTYYHASNVCGIPLKNVIHGRLCYSVNVTIVCYTQIVLPHSMGLIDLEQKSI